jgi:phosphoglycerol transferase MdoB-like AlkP superfamily enzyme
VAIVKSAWQMLLRAWCLVLVWVLVLGLVRLGQTVYLWPGGLDLPALDIVHALFQGLRFDLKVSAVAVLLLLWVLPWACERICTLIAAVGGGVLAFLSLANTHYLAFYKTPIDDMVFGLIEDDTSAVLHTIWRDFAVLTTLGIVLVLGMWAARQYRWMALRVLPMPCRLPYMLPIGLILFLALAFSAKGTLRAMALQRQHLAITTSPFLNDMVPNGAIALKYAWDSRRFSQNLRNPLSGLHKMGFDSPASAAQVLGLAHQSDARIQTAMVQHARLPAGTAKKNLLFFLMESWSAEPLLYQSSRFDVLGRLAQPLQNACHFSNFDSAQGGTHPSLEALLFSTPITPLTLGAAGRKPLPWSVAQVAKSAGYQTLFVTSGRAGWRNLDRVLKVQGFDEVIDASTLQAHYPQAPLGIWGTWDSYVFQYLTERLAKRTSMQPIFVFVLTSTNHPPYDLPNDYQRVSRDMALWLGETHSDALQRNLDTYHYASDLLGAFVQEMQAGPMSTHTLIAATGDHNVRTFGLYAPVQRRHLMRQVPFVVWGAEPACSSQTELPASHRDIFPTLLPLAGIEGDYLNAGRSLWTSIAPKTNPTALFYPGEARNQQGMWQLGNSNSFICTPALKPSENCQFNPQDDAQERARLGLLDWYIRTAIHHGK